MEKVEVWYLTDNKTGELTADAIGGLGIKTNLIRDEDFSAADINQDVVNIFIIDFSREDINRIFNMLKSDQRLNSFLKFIFLVESKIKIATELSMNLMRVEFLSKPLNNREFLLLLEKSIVVERYRLMMRRLSAESESRIEADEKLLNIKRHDVLSPEATSHDDFLDKVMEFERNMLREQDNLNSAIKNFTLCCQREVLELGRRITAEDMLTILRRKELIDANDVIRAQEALISFSTKELGDANAIIDAREKVEELSRKELESLRASVERLERENNELKQNLNKK